MSAPKTYYNDSIGKLECERDEWKARAERAERIAEAVKGLCDAHDRQPRDTPGAIEVLFTTAIRAALEGA